MSEVTNTTQLHHGILTENTDLISLSKDQSYQPIFAADYLLPCCLLQPYFFFKLIPVLLPLPQDFCWFWRPFYSKQFLFSAFQFLSSTSRPSFPQSYSTSCFLTHFHSNFQQDSVYQATCVGQFLSVTHWRKSQNPLSTPSSRIIVPTCFRPAAIHVCQHGLAFAALILGERPQKTTTQEHTKDRCL